MCGGVEYKAFNAKTGLVELRRTYFPFPQAQLPVVGPKGAALVCWGRRQGEHPDSDLPQGGWARQDSLVKGRWKKYNPVPVIIPVAQFMEKDKEGKSHWFQLQAHEVIQGIGVFCKGQPLVYVVTEEAGPEQVHSRVPKIITLEQAAELGSFAWPKDFPWMGPTAGDEP